jgi:hypothetical protein
LIEKTGAAAVIATAQAEADEQAKADEHKPK